MHNDAAALREWLRHRDDFLEQCGAWLDSKLVRIDPIERRSYEHLEYSPLVNQRAHRLGAERRIANSGASARSISTCSTSSRTSRRSTPWTR